MIQEKINNPLLESMTWQQFFEAYRPEGLILQYMKVDNVYKSVRDKRLSLADINAHYGECFHRERKFDFGILYIYEWLLYLNSVSNINKPLPAKSMEQLSLILYTKYYLFYLSDFKLVLEGILESKYGKFYGSVDSQLIMSAFKEYSESRKVAIAKIKSRSIH